VYPSDSSNVNSELVESIRVPALDPNAAEVFYRVITKNGSGPQAFVDDIIKELECPVLLAWGGVRKIHGFGLQLPTRCKSKKVVYLVFIYTQCQVKFMANELDKLPKTQVLSLTHTKLIYISSNETTTARRA